MTAAESPGTVTNGDIASVAHPADDFEAVATIFARAVELDLAGSVHDALIAQVCADAEVPIVTLDGRQHRLALALGARSTYLLA